MQNRISAARLSAVAACACAALSSYAQNAPAAEAANLATTVVTAGRMQQNLNDVIADMSIVDRDTIEKSGANSVADILARQPGIEISRTGGPASTTKLFVRGGLNQYTAVLIDGVRVDSQNFAPGMNWNNLPASQIERIEILRGPSAAVYGSDAMAGVIQIFTRKGRPGFHPSVELGFGSDNTQKFNTNLSGGTGAFDYALSLGYENSKGYDARPSVSTVSRDRDGYRRNSGSVQLGWNINAQHRLEFSALESHSRGQFDQDKKDNLTFNDTRTQSLSWNAKWSEQYQSRLVYTLGTDRYQTANVASPYESQTDVQSYLWHNEFTSGIHRLNVDLERREDRLSDDKLLGTPSRRRSQDSLATGYSLNAGAHALQANVRYDDDSEYGQKTTGSLGYAYRITPNWRISASAGTAFRAPSFYQRFSQYGTAGLKAESGRSHEIALRYADGGDEFSATYYQNRYTNQIALRTKTPSNTCANATQCYTNIAQAKNTGLTLSAATTLHQIRVGGSWDFQTPKGFEPSANAYQLLERRARRSLKLTADTELAGVNVGAEVQAVGRRFDKAGEKSPLGAYTLLNLTAKKSFTPAWELLGRIDNVGNKHYETAGTYATGGRQLYIGLRWTGQ
jgi:vitamin B12 transporter